MTADFPTARLRCVALFVLVGLPGCDQHAVVSSEVDIELSEPDSAPRIQYEVIAHVPVDDAPPVRSSSPPPSPGFSF